MKKTIKLFGIIALVAAIGFSMAGCDWLFEDGSPEITTTSLPDGSTGMPYSQTLAAKGESPITWSIASGSLPTGFNLVGNLITGMPVTAGTSTFTVKAENTVGSDTKELSITITGVAAGAPTGLTATAASSSSIILDWTAVTGATGYTVYRSSSAGGTYTSVRTQTTAGYTNTGLTANTTYYYQVTANTAGGESARSTTASATTLAPSAWTAVVDTKFGEGYGSAIEGVAWGGGAANRFVAVGADGKMAHSSNGETWTAVANSQFGDSNIYAIAWGNNKFVAGGGGAKMATSPDGVTWTPVANTNLNLPTGVPTGGTVYAIAWCNNKFVAGDRWGAMAYSSDGLTWTAVADSPFTDGIRAISYGGGKFVAVGDNGKMAYSSDGETWTAVTNSTFTASDIIRGVAWGGNKFVAGGDSSRMAYSTDGITWTAITNHTFPPTVSGESSAGINAIVWGGNKFVAGGFYIDLGTSAVGNKTVYSTDGVTWTAGTAGGVIFSEVWASPKAIAWGNNTFVAVGGDGLFAPGQISYSATGQ